MNLFLELGKMFDVFYFSIEPKNESTHSIKLLEIDLFKAIQSSLLQKKCVYIFSNADNFDLVNLNIHSKKHYYLEKNKFIFLNFTLKKQIAKLNTQENNFENYQSVENCFSRLNSIFN